MKIRKRTREGDSREVLLREYFLNAYLIATMKRLGIETARRAQRSDPRQVPARQG